MAASICLNMIVKNEAHVIRRCLASARPLINHWVIVDTGSTDGTQDLIREVLSDLPGELHERPWKNFGHNRNEALDLARDKADYVLVIDADETFLVPDGFEWPELTADAYRIQAVYGDMVYDRASLVAMKKPWFWKGVLHEYLDTPGEHWVEQLSAPRIFVRHDGARAHDPKTYERDAALLEEALIDEPDNTRYQFYLAQSYRDSHRFQMARDAYLKRAAMGGWEEEAWYSRFQAVSMLEALGGSDDEVITGYLTVWEQRPSRIEPLHSLARRLRLQGRYEMAAMMARRGVLQPMPNDILFVDASVYRWQMKDEFSVAASYSPHQRADAYRALQEILSERHFPADQESRLLENLKFFEGRF
jgi:tetratricopeptide (TPR) repeat protein